MRPAQDLEKLIKKLHFKVSADLHERTISDALQAQAKSKKIESAQVVPIKWRFIMKNNASKLAAGILIRAILLSLLVFEKLSSPAWALSETIEVLRDFGGLHMIGTVTIDGQEKGTEIWMQANKSKTSSQDTVARITNGIVQWAKDGSTYTYIPEQNTVYYENAVTAGASPWIGPAMLEMLGKMEGTKIIKGKDPVTGGGRVTLIGSIQNVNGFNEYVIEFDTEKKQPVT